MAQLSTRPMLRDQIRRLLLIRPPADYGGPFGAQPTDRPAPSNEQINDNLQYALSDINNACGTHSTQLTLSVQGQSASLQGPLAIYEGNLTYAGQANASVFPTGIINDVQRVLWQDGSGNITELTPKDARALDRAQDTYYQNNPSVPQYYYTEGYVLNIFPAPSSDGTLILTCGTGFLGLQSETDLLDQFPIDFQPILIYQTIVRLSKAQTLDAEAQQRAQNFLPDALEGMKTVQAWKKGLSGTAQPSFAADTYRRGYGTFQMRR